MEQINALIKKYQRMIDNETSYLASPSSDNLPEDQRQLFTQRIIDWREFVADLKTITDIS